MSVRRIAQEREWKIDGLRICGLSWGDTTLPTIVALHGWLDNAASFLELAPLLADYQVVSIDLPGHGLSDDRSPDSTYQIWDDLPQLCRVVENVSSPPVVLMGHSRGAIISMLLAAVLRKKVSSIIALDALIPEAQIDGSMIFQLRKFIEERQKLVGRSPTYLPSRKDVLERRCSTGLSLGAADILASRSLFHAEDKGYYWRFDHRLKGASAMKLSRDNLLDLLNNIDVPVMLAVASDGYIRESNYLKSISGQLKSCEVVNVTGGHHFHLEGGAYPLSQMINCFLARETQI